MSFLISLFVVLHMICWAVALGTWVASARTRGPNKGVAHATAVALVFGIALAALDSLGGDPNHIANGKQTETPSAVWFGIPTAIIVNIVVAVFV